MKPMTCLPRLFGPKYGIIGRQGISLNVGLQPFPAIAYARLLKALEAEVKRIFLPPKPSL